MKLIKCHIENFGKFCDYDFNFTEGMNIFKEENGWGKTTFAAFLKAMLYGLAYKPNSKEFYDRKKYAPWRGGNFGGYLIFETDVSVYRVTRYFGKRDADDTFELTDMRTNMPSDAYGAKLGEEIFGIDMESFERSVYILSGNMDTSMTDSISAKLNNLIDNADDINNYEKACGIIDKELKLLSKRGGNGEIQNRLNKINELKDKIKECDNKNLRLKLLRERADEYAACKEECNKEILKLDAMINNAHVQEKKNQYRQLAGERERIAGIISEKEQFFNNDIPDIEDIDEMLELSHHVTALLKILDESCFDNVDLTRIESLLIDRERYEDYKYETENIEKLSEAKELKDIVAVKKSDYDKVKKKYDERINVTHKDEDLYAILATLSFIISTYCAYIFFQDRKLLVIVMASLIALSGLLMLIREIVIRYREKRKLKYEENLKNLKEEIDSMGERAWRLERDYHFFIDYRSTYEKLLKGYNFLNGKIDEFGKTVNKLETYLKRFPEEFVERTVKRYPQNITLKALADNRGKGPLGDGRVYIKMFQAIRDYRDIYLRNTAALADVEKRMEKFVENNKGIDFSDMTEDAVRDVQCNTLCDVQCNELRDVQCNELRDIPPLDVLIKDREEYEAKAEDYTAKLSMLTKEMDMLSVEADKIQDYELEMQRLSAEKEEMEKRYEILSLSRKYLDEARSELSVRYMSDMKTAFDGYVTMFDPNENYSISMNLDTKIEKNGKERSSRHLSRGGADMINLSTRLALADAMFKETKPFIIIDDPFANFDEQRLTKGISLMKKLAADRQIIYFTCHESRVCGMEKISS